MIVLTAQEQQLLQNSGITGLILFGSQSQGAARSDSDFDFLVLGKKSTGNYDLVYDLLAKKINQLVDIDIVFSADAPMELLNHVVKYGQPIYQSASSVFADFKAQTMLESADFARSELVQMAKYRNRLVHI